MFLAFVVAATGCATQGVTKTEKDFTAAVNTIEVDRAPAAECLNGKNWDCKNARKNDPADQYMLDGSGNLYRYFKTSKRTCQVTSNVKDFKISMHPNDHAVIYYESNNKLFVVHPQGASGDCPPVAKKVIMDNVKEWKMATNRDTTIVNAALDESGKFVAWDDSRPVYVQYNVVDFQMNQCFRVQGKSFSSYVLFTLDRSGDVKKVKMTEDYIFIYNNSEIERGNWRDISDWKQSRNVCN